MWCKDPCLIVDLGLGQVSSLEGDGKSRDEVPSGWRLKRNLIKRVVVAWQ